VIPNRIHCLAGRCLAVLSVFLAAGAGAAPSMPPYFVLPPQAQAGEPRFESYGEEQFDLADDKPAILRGKHWGIDFTLPGLPDETTGKAMWEKYLAPPLLKSGWTVAKVFDTNPFSVLLRYTKGGKDAWAHVTAGNPSALDAAVIELGAQPRVVTLARPAAKPETVIPDHGDFPYLAPMPGSKLEQGGRNDKPMFIQLPGSDQSEAVGSGSISKDYAAPEGLSSVEFFMTYDRALRGAGWEIVNESQGIRQSDAFILAHYGRDGRDLWAYLHGTPAEYSFDVADVGADDLAADLAKRCHAILSGVLFDFNKSTLKAESAPALGHVAELLAKQPALKVEVQGHTDAVGNDTYNQSLSQSRAQSVVAWLAAHGVAAARLSAKGYGKTQPIDDNSTDEGRARNRRVEIANPDCKR
jgi:OOP family OmpA-OmpF porin